MGKVTKGIPFWRSRYSGRMHRLPLSVMRALKRRSAGARGWGAAGRCVGRCVCHESGLGARGERCPREWAGGVAGDVGEEGDVFDGVERAAAVRADAVFALGGATPDAAVLEAASGADPCLRVGELQS